MSARRRDRGDRPPAPPTAPPARTRASASPATRDAHAPPLPPLARDPWAWASALAFALLWVFSAGAPLGEPVADDYVFLHHLRFTPQWSWFDGGGTALYWRPLARQAYFALLGDAMLAVPRVVALAHLVGLALAAVLVYAALRRSLGPAPAFAAATFAAFMESSRLLIAWPSNFQDVGCILFVSAALHEAVARRLPTFLLASLAAFLCKEVGAVGAGLVLFCPAVRFASRRERWVWLASFAALAAAWLLTYRWVYVHAPLEPPASQMASIGSLPAWPERLTAVTVWGLKAIVSLLPVPIGTELPIGAAVAALAVAWLAVLVASAKARRRLRAAAPWIGWGLAWFVPLMIAHLPFYASWSSYRVVFVGLGLGIAIVAALAATHRALLWAWLGLRLACLPLAPAPARGVEPIAPDVGSAFDIPRLTRLQRFVSDVRVVLRGAHPTLPPRSRILRYNFPRSSEFAFGNDQALQVWYGDPTLTWERFTSWRREPDRPAVAIVEYAEGRESVALVRVPAMRAMLRALDHLNAGRIAEALPELEAAHSLQGDTTAAVFRGTVLGKMAYVWLELGAYARAESLASHAVRLYPSESEGLFTLAAVAFHGGRLEQARERLRVLLSYEPEDVPARRLLASVDSARLAPPSRGP